MYSLLLMALTAFALALAASCEKNNIIALFLWLAYLTFDLFILIPHAYVMASSAL